MTLPPLTPSLLLLLTLLLPAPPARADERTALDLTFERRTYPFAPADVNAPPAVAQDETGAQCKLVSNLPGDRSATLKVWDRVKPPLGRGPFSVIGTVACRDLRDKPARLELRVEYADGTDDRVSPEPPEANAIVGTSDGRAFRIDYPGQPDGPPRKLTLAVVMQGAGVVMIRDAKLVVADPPATAPAAKPRAAATPASPEAAADAAMASMLDDQLAQNLMGPTRLKQARDEMAEGLKIFREERRGDTPDDRERIRLKELILAAYDRRLAAIGAAGRVATVAAPTTGASVLQIGAPAGGPTDPAVRAWMDQMRKDRRDMPNAGLGFLDQDFSLPSGGTIELHPDAETRLKEAKAAADRVQAMLDALRNGKSIDPSNGGPTTTSAAGTAGTPLRDLPPAVAAQRRQSMRNSLDRFLQRRDDLELELQTKEGQLGRGSQTVESLRLQLRTINEKIAALEQALAEPSPPAASAGFAVPRAVLAPGEWTNFSLSDRAYWSFSQFLAIHVGVLFGGLLMWQFVRQGHFRRLATAYFAVVIVCGLAEIFGAGVAVGRDRPSEVAIVFLCGAMAMIGGPVLLLPHLNRVHADVELRKLRAMDVA